VAARPHPGLSRDLLLFPALLFPAPCCRKALRLCSELRSRSWARFGTAWFRTSRAVTDVRIWLYLFLQLSSLTQQILRCAWWMKCLNMRILEVQTDLRVITYILFGSIASVCDAPDCVLQHIMCLMAFFLKGRRTRPFTMQEQELHIVYSCVNQGRPVCRMVCYLLYGSEEPPYSLHCP
jgi:hypothetical protein